MRALRRRALLALVESARAPQRPVFSRLLGDERRGRARVGGGRPGASGDGRRSRGAARGQRRRRSRRGDRGRSTPAPRSCARGERRHPPPGARRCSSASAIHAPPCAPPPSPLPPPGCSIPNSSGARARGSRRSLRRARPRPGRLGRGARASAAGDLAVEAAGDPDPWVRAAAARAAGSLEAFELLDRLAADDSALVRESAFVGESGARGAPAAGPLHALPRRSGDRSCARAVLDRVGRGAGGAVRAHPQRLRQGRALLARARAGGGGRSCARAPSRRPPSVDRSSRRSKVSPRWGTYPVRIGRRRRSGRSAGRVPPSAPPPPRARRTTTAAWSAQTRQARWVRLETSRGDAVLRLDPSQAPLQSIAFLKLAEQGFYDGTQVHRVVPGLRLEAGDPDGDGRGGPGFTLRDEPSPRRLEPGAVRAGAARGPRGGEPLLRPARPRRRGRGGGNPVGTGGVRSRRPGGRCSRATASSGCAGSRPR